MPSTRSGTKYDVGPEHHGRYAEANRTFSSKKKRRQELGDRSATRFQTSRRVQKRIKLGDAPPPTPTKEEILKLERARRGGNPTCLHFGVDKDVREYLYPNNFFCAHCDDYVETMIHSTNKKAVKRDSQAFICQGGHTNFITPTTIKEDKLHWRLFADIPEDAGLEVEEMSATAPRVERRTATPTTTGTTPKTVTPAASTPLPVIPLVIADPASRVLRNLQADYQDLLGKDAQNADKLLALEAKLSELSKELEDPRRLQQKYNDLQKRYQSLILETMDSKGLVSRAINLPFDGLNEFDGSDAVIDDTLVKRQKKVTKFVTMLTQTLFLTDSLEMRS
jgi:hypothetical protein